MLFTLLLVIPLILASVLFLYTTAGILIHLWHLYLEGKSARASHST
ncbi:MAG TPA: hypothetical protein VJS44_06770 [Pyrinomonadaceae bacterium]|nr:hypothetical protein [Pyrinomonadaceae bacterium]